MLAVADKLLPVPVRQKAILMPAAPNQIRQLPSVPGAPARQKAILMSAVPNQILQRPSVPGALVCQKAILMPAVTDKIPKQRLAVPAR